MMHKKVAAFVVSVISDRKLSTESLFMQFEVGGGFISPKYHLVW